MEHNNQKLEFFKNPAKWTFMAIGPCATNSGKWGIPENNYKNVAQQ